MQGMDWIIMEYVCCLCSMTSSAITTQGKLNNFLTMLLFDTSTPSFDSSLEIKYVCSETYYSIYKDHPRDQQNVVLIHTGGIYMQVQ